MNATQNKRAAEKQLAEAKPLLVGMIGNYIGRSQANAMADILRGPERYWMAEVVIELAERVRSMSKTYEQDGLGDDAIVSLHYFTAGCDWHITERDSEDEQHQAFGRADIGYGPEMGYISLRELVEAGAELDLHWTPKRLGDCK